MIPFNAMCTCGHVLGAHAHETDSLPCDALRPTESHWRRCECTAFAWDAGKTYENGRVVTP